MMARDSTIMALSPIYYPSSDYVLTISGIEYSTTLFRAAEVGVAILTIVK